MLWGPPGGCSSISMFGIVDCGNKHKANSVWVMFWYSGNLQEATNQRKTKTGTSTGRLADKSKLTSTHVMKNAFGENIPRTITLS